MSPNKSFIILTIELYHLCQHLLRAEYHILRQLGLGHLALAVRQAGGINCGAPGWAAIANDLS